MSVNGNISAGGDIRGTVSGPAPIRGSTGGMKVLHTDSYAIAVANGFVGTVDEWLESLKGPKGDTGISPVVAVEDIDGGHRVTITDKNGAKQFDVMDGTVTEEQIASAVEDYMAEHPVEVTDIVKTVNGIAPDENGNVNVEGGTGGTGADGFSPGAKVTQTDTGAIITITDKSGTTTATVFNGKDGKDGYTPVKGVDYFDGTPGKDGNPGADGYTPVKGKDYFDGEDGQDGSPGKDGADGVSATHSWNGTVLTVTSASGTSSADLKGATGNPGKDGSNGQPGADGVSPTVAVSKSGKVTTVAITDKNGTKTATINDGADGSPGSAGKDGTSVTVKSVSESTADGGSNVVAFSDGKTLTVKNGSKGSTGASGSNGKDSLPLFYISPSGSDSNDGLTAGTPKKTVKACVNAGAKRISAKRGTYAEQVSLSNTDHLEIFPTDNDLEYSTDADWPSIVFDLSDTIAVGSLADYNSIKRVAYSNSANEQFDKVFTKQSQPPVTDTYGSLYNAAVWLMSNDEKTVCKKLKPVLTVAECEAEANTFSWVGGYIYINADMTGVEKICVPTNWDSGFRIDNAGKVILREVEVRFSGAYNLWILNCPYFELYKCSARYSSYASGIDIDNANGTLTACYATKNFDGFGISGYGHTTYIDCVSEFNFDDGVSHHNGSCGTFIGGRYEGNGKGGNTPAYGAQVNIYGGIYKDNASFGIGYLYTSTKNPAGGMIQGAVMVGNPIGLNVDANCTVTAINCLYKDNAIDKKASGNLVEYNPDYVKTVNGVKADENGNVKIEVSGGESGEDTNLLHSAINTDKSEYVGINGEDGYKVNRRLSSSATTTDYEKDSEKNCCTGYISAAQGEVFRVENSTFEASGYSCIYFFDSTFKLITGVGIASSAMKSLYVDGVLSFTVPSNTSIAYVRICTGVISDATVITKTA